jgi:PPM family protein phosphatase
LITPEQARSHPNIHVIRRFLGSRQPVEPDTRLRLSPGEENAQSEANQGLQLHSKDTIVLCSDGLTDLVAESEILANFQKDGLQDSIERLIRIANQRGGHDNITLVALQVPEPPDAPQEKEIIKKPRRNKLLTISLIIVLIVALLAGLAWASQKVLKRGETQLTDTAPAAGQLTQPVSSITPTDLPSATPYRPTAIQTEVPSTMPPLTSTSLPPAATFTPWPTNTSIP